MMLRRRRRAVFPEVGMAAPNKNVREISDVVLPEAAKELKFVSGCDSISYVCMFHCRLLWLFLSKAAQLKLDQESIDKR